MIRRWFILGILVIVMVSLLWNFYKEVVVYHALAAAKESIKVSQKTQETIPFYKQAWSKNIVNKNPFSKDRGYIPAAVAPKALPSETVPEIAPELPDLTLNGIILDQYGEYIAFIQVNGAQPKRVRKGDMFDGILVVDISTRDVKLLWNDEDMTLTMKKIKTVPRKR